MVAYVKVSKHHLVNFVIMTRVITDINECQISNGGCAHACTNTDGSYYCECYTGYILQPSQHDCLKRKELHRHTYICHYTMHVRSETPC